MSLLRYRFLCIAGVWALLISALSGCGASSADSVAEKEIWRFALEESEGSVQHAYALRFKQLVEARTDGAIEVVVYPYGTLGTSTHITEQLNLGIVELAMASPGVLGKFIPELQVFLLHFVLPEDDLATKRLLSDPELVAYFDQLYAPKGLKLLSFFAEGAMVWTTKKEVRRPEHFDGLKMRVMTSPLLLAAYEAYGASPTPMPYAEVYSALQLNMVDGQVNPIFAIERQKFHEVTSWLIFPGHTSYVGSCAANRDFYERLSTERKKMLADVMEELDDYIFEVQTRLQTERLKVILRDVKRRRAPYFVCGDLERFVESLTDEERIELIEENADVEFLPGLTDDERAAFERASASVRETYLEIGGPKADEVLDRLLSAVK